MIYKSLCFALVTVFVSGTASSRATAQVSITATGTYSQNFDSLVSTGSGTWTDNSTIAGWYAQRSGTGTSITADAGSGTGGNLYSYGAASNSDRALGSIGSSNAAAGSFAWGVLLQNNSGSSVTFGTLSYVGEQWRNSAAAAQTVTFWYKISSSSITALTPTSSAGWTAVTALDFTSPVTGGTAGALVGNTAGNKTSVSSSSALSSITLSSGQFIMFRFADPDHTGTDHGLAIDDFSVAYTVSAIPEPSTYAAIFGTLALVGTVWHRRRQRKAA